jgi:hypothetical protein
MEQTPPVEPVDQPVTPAPDPAAPAPVPTAKPVNLEVIPEGTVLQNGDGHQEKIVYDTDPDGTVIGWHKEVV